MLALLVGIAVEPIDSSWGWRIVVFVQLGLMYVAHTFHAFLDVPTRISPPRMLTKTPSMFPTG